MPVDKEMKYDCYRHAWMKGNRVGWYSDLIEKYRGKSTNIIVDGIRRRIGICCTVAHVNEERHASKK